MMLTEASPSSVEISTVLEDVSCGLGCGVVFVTACSTHAFPFRDLMAIWGIIKLYPRLSNVTGSTETNLRLIESNCR